MGSKADGDSANEQVKLLNEQIEASQVEKDALKFKIREYEGFTLNLQKRLIEMGSAREQDAAAAQTSEGMQNTLDEVTAALQAAEQRAKEAEQKLAEAEAKAQKPAGEVQEIRSPGGDEFNLPDFVWSCGNSQVMD